MFNMKEIGLEICANCHTGIRQNEPAFVLNGNVVCQKCNKALRKDDADSPLPGTIVAAFWEIIGILSLGICIAVGIVAVALMEKSGTGERTISLVIWVGVGVAWSIIPFSVAAIIKAINANTKELRRIRYAMAKFFSEKMK
jgi:hypothetical protein